jgi:hypothetical protein
MRWGAGLLALAACGWDGMSFMSADAQSLAGLVFFQTTQRVGQGVQFVAGWPKIRWPIVITSS